MARLQNRRWCFTLNNYDDTSLLHLRALGESGITKYLIYGKETGQEGTRHLQGFVIFNASRTLLDVKLQLGGNRFHCEIARGTSPQASDYCKKDGDFEEHGELPVHQGKRTDWDRYKDYVRDLGRVPNQRELANDFTSLYARYSRALVEIAKAVLEPPSLTDSNPRFGYQTRVCGRIEGEPNPRTIDFVVDPEGNSGKSWITQWALSKYPEETQILGVGKRDDIAFAIDPTKSIFLFDVPREQMQFFQYSLLEMLKNRIVMNNKYHSETKVLARVPYVAVFSNEMPNMDALSSDRYNIIEVTDENRGN